MGHFWVEGSRSLQLDGVVAATRWGQVPGGTSLCRTGSVSVMSSGCGCSHVRPNLCLPVPAPGGGPVSVGLTPALCRPELGGRGPTSSLWDGGRADRQTEWPSGPSLGWAAGGCGGEHSGPGAAPALPPVVGPQVGSGGECDWYDFQQVPPRRVRGPGPRPAADEAREAGLSAEGRPGQAWENTELTACTASCAARTPARTRPGLEGAQAAGMLTATWCEVGTEPTAVVPPAPACAPPPPWQETRFVDLAAGPGLPARGGRQASGQGPPNVVSTAGGQGGGELQDMPVLAAVAEGVCPPPVTSSGEPSVLAQGASPCHAPPPDPGLPPLVQVGRQGPGGRREPCASVESSSPGRG